MIEPEIAFADLRENMEVAEGYVRFVLRYALEKYPQVQLTMWKAFVVLRMQEFEFLESYEKKLIADRKLAEKKANKGGKQQKVTRDFKETPLRERVRFFLCGDRAQDVYLSAIASRNCGC